MDGAARRASSIRFHDASFAAYVDDRMRQAQTVKRSQPDTGPPSDKLPPESPDSEPL
jgi:hypothetical protein